MITNGRPTIGQGPQRPNFAIPTGCVVGADILKRTRSISTSPYRKRWFFPLVYVLCLLWFAFLHAPNCVLALRLPRSAPFALTSHSPSMAVSCFAVRADHVIHGVDRPSLLRLQRRIRVLAVSCGPISVGFREVAAKNCASACWCEAVTSNRAISRAERVRMCGI